MKKLLKIFALTLSLVLLITLISCNKKGDGNGENNGDNTQGDITETIDRTDPSAGKYKIRFFLGNTPNYVIHYYNEGETITPPETLPSYETPGYTCVFNGWDGVVFEVVSGNAVYRANYIEDYKYTTISFKVLDQVKEYQVAAGSYPKEPNLSEFDLPEGVEFVCWDKQFVAASEDVTYQAITTACFDKETFLAAYNTGLLIYPSSTTARDNSTTNTALALSVLMMEEATYPVGGAVADRIVEHLTAMVQKDQAPSFDACCFWNYNPHTATIAMAKATPTVWNKVPADVKLRLDTMMKAFAMLESFATSDYNSYGTGPSMLGNYGKDWNPNYRLANVPVMIYVTHYFGNGDMEEGAATVNFFLKNFNEDTYTDMINTFQKYGWRRAFLCWTADARTSTDGKNIQGRSAKDLMISGGQAVGEDTPTDSDLLVALGTGVGVNNGGKDYLYKGYGLNEPDGIIRSLVMHNYGSGDLTKTNPYKSNFLLVKSDHWYDTNKDGVNELVAWIEGDLSSPYEGQYGMMKEFASGNRSSTGYCSHDFVLTLCMLYSCKVLGIYDITEDTYKDNNGTDIRSAIIVGNEDFLFKNENGYMGYATGSYGESHKVHSEKNESKAAYFTFKKLWKKVVMPDLESALSAEAES